MTLLLVIIEDIQVENKKIIDHKKYDTKMYYWGLFLILFNFKKNN